MQKGMLFFQDTKRKKTYRMNKKSEKNLPLYGIGPVIVFGQLLIAGGAIAISCKFNIIYNKNSPTSSGSEMNCRFDHKYS